MKTISRDAWLAIGLFVVLVLVTSLAAAQQVQSVRPPAMTPVSSAPDGAMALRLWLINLGYITKDEVASTFQPSLSTDLILVLEPTSELTENDFEVLDTWVWEGGVLVLAGDGLDTAMAAQHYDFAMRYLLTPVESLAWQSPLHQSPSVTGTTTVRTEAYFHSTRVDYVAHLAVAQGPVVVSFPYGDGRVVLSATAYPFSNAGLKETGNGEVVLNLLSILPRRGRVWFDEWHHGDRSTTGDDTPLGPGAFLRGTAAGRSLLYVASVLFLALLLSGRAFGRPVALAHAAARRAPVEFISALAHLGRRAGHSQAVLGQYRQHLKRRLGWRYRLDPALADDEYVTRLARFDPSLNAAALRRLLARLRQPGASERELVQLAAEAAAWTKD